MAEVKKVIRDKELWEADMQDDDQDQKIVNQTQHKVDKVDAFFASDDDDDKDDEPKKPNVEKRAVLRDGRVPKLAKNFEKL